MTKCSWSHENSCGAPIHWMIYGGKPVYLCYQCSSMLASLRPKTTEMFKSRREVEIELLKLKL